MNSDIHFNLIDEAWIPCETHEGKPIELSLLSMFQQAHTLRRLSGVSPLLVPALTRVLLALIHRAWDGPKSDQEWKELWDRGHFEMEPLRAYFQKWHHRFDLFDRERPFYQCPGMNYKTREPASLIAERSTYGTPVLLFEHRPELFPADLSPAEAARQLIVTQNFGLGGLMTRAAGEPPSAAAAPLALGAAVLIGGQNLFETLLLNLLLYNPAQGEPQHVPADPDRDMPAWEWPELLHAQPGIKRSPFGWLDLLTWQSRRLFLHAGRKDGQIRVQSVILAGGLDLVSENVREPMMAFRTIEKVGPKALRFSPERALWRDATALFRLSADDSPPPQACARLATCLERGWVSEEHLYWLDVYGQSSDQALIHLFRHERFPLPPALLLQHETLVAYLNIALKLAEDTWIGLRMALRAVGQNAVSPGFDPEKQKGRKPQGEDITKIVQSMGSEGFYWAALGYEFERLVLDICAPETGGEQALSAWKNSLRRIARRCFRQGSQALGTTARVLKGVAFGERTLNIKLKEILGDADNASANASPAEMSAP